MKKRYMPIAIAIPLGILGFAGTAFAHNGGITAGCNNGQPRAVVNLTNYNGTNTISVKADGGANLTPGTFGSSYNATFALGSPYTAHVVVYKVTAHDDPNNNNGWSPGGTLNVPACQVAPTTTTTTPPTTSTAPTTTVPSSTTVVVTEPTTSVIPTTTVVSVDLPPVPCAYDIALPADSPLCLQVVAVVDPIPTVPVELGIASRILPATGAHDDGLWLACSLVVAGSITALIARRRRSA